MFNRPISWLVVLQPFAILFGHAAGVLGEACYLLAAFGLAGMAVFLSALPIPLLH